MVAFVFVLVIFVVGVFIVVVFVMVVFGCGCLCCGCLYFGSLCCGTATATASATAPIPIVRQKSGFLNVKNGAVHSQFHFILECNMRRGGRQPHKHTNIAAYTLNRAIGHLGLAIFSPTRLDCLCVCICVTKVVIVDKDKSIIIIIFSSLFFLLLIK